MGGMGIIQALRAKWHTDRAFCWYCGVVPVLVPNSCCSEECEIDAANEG